MCKFLTFERNVVAMENIIYTLEFDSDQSNETTNEYLAKGWQLLYVGQKSYIDSSGNLLCNTSYVIGATQQVYDAWKKEQLQLRQTALRVKDFVISNDNGNF